MLKETKGIVLRSVKYGETSLICTIFTEQFGVQSYIAKGVRSAKSKQNKSSLLQPTTMLEIIAYHSSTKNIQYLRDYNFCYSYHNLQQQVVKNSIALFSVEFLLRLLPENAPLHDLFIFCEYYFQLLDKFQENEIANFPLFFIAQSSKLLGYELKGKFSQETPYLNIPEGGFSNQQSLIAPVMTVENGQLLHNLLMCKELEIISSITMNATIRMQSLEWYLSFLHYHTQHISQLKSLQVLRTILH